MLGRSEPGDLRLVHARRARVAHLRVGRGARRERALPADEQRGRVRRPGATTRSTGPAAWSRTRPRGRTTATRSATRSSSSRCPVVEVHLSNVDEREEWRRHSVVTRDRGAAGSSARARTATARRSSTWRRPRERAHREASAPSSRSRCSSRTASTSATSPASRARTRRCSSSPTACACSPTSATARPPRAVEGVELVETKRLVIEDDREAPRGPGRLRGEPRSPTRATRRSPPAMRSSSRARAWSSGCARSRTTASSTRSAAPRAVTNAAFEAFAEERFIGRHRARPGLAARGALPRARRRGPRVRDDRGRRPARRAAAPPRRRPRDRGRRHRRRRRGRRRRRLRVRLHAHLRGRAARRRAPRGLRASASPPSWPRSRRSGPA